jgi:hypothetical protein
VREVHGDLARQRDLGPAAREVVQVIAADAEDLHHGLLDGFA